MFPDFKDIINYVYLNWGDRKLNLNKFLWTGNVLPTVA